MATKAELLEQAKALGLDVKSSITKKELESTLQNSNFETVVVNENENGEAKAGTTEDGQTDPVENTESVPQNGVTEIETLNAIEANADSSIAEEADAARTKKNIQFADESNPNQKGRNTVAPGEYDQDGNLRTDGKSYGVSDDSHVEVSEETLEINAGEKKEEEARFDRVYAEPSEDGALGNHYNDEDAESLEKELSDEKKSIVARVTTAAGSYVRIKFFKDGKPFGTYKSRQFKLKEAKEFLKRLVKGEEV